MQEAVTGIFGALPLIILLGLFASIWVRNKFFPKSLQEETFKFLTKYYKDKK